MRAADASRRKWALECLCDVDASKEARRSAEDVLLSSRRFIAVIVVVVEMSHCFPDVAGPRRARR